MEPIEIFKGFNWESDDVCILVNLKTGKFKRCKSMPTYALVPNPYALGPMLDLSVHKYQGGDYRVQDGWSHIIENPSETL